MHGTIGSYNISAFWYLPKYANRWNKYSKWRSMDWARCLLLIIENSQQISTRPGSALYRSIHSNRRLAIYRTLPHLTLSTDIYLANNQPWRSFSTSWQCSAAQASHSWTYVTAVLTYWIEPKAQHQTPVFNSTSRGRLPRCIDGLSMNAYFTSQCHSSRCGARLLQSYRSSALRLHATRHPSCTCRITKRTKTNTDLYSTIESEGHTYLLEYSPKSLPATQLPWTSR